MGDEESPLSEEQLDLMAMEGERNVESACSFFRQLLETDTKVAPDYFADGKVKSIGGDLAAASEALDSELARIADGHLADQALGKTAQSSFTHENIQRLMKAGITLLMLEKSALMLERAKVRPTMAMLSSLALLAGKLRGFSRSIGQMQVEDAFAFYHYDAYPAFRALCEALGIPFEADLQGALSDGKLKEALGARLRKKMEEAYGGVGDGKENRP